MKTSRILTTANQREQIKAELNTELRRRGYDSPIIYFEEANNRFEFHSAEFQTDPVVFKTLQIRNFSSNIFYERNDDNQKLFFWFQVDVCWEAFNGGTNSTTLFEMRGELINDEAVNIAIK